LQRVAVLVEAINNLTGPRVVLVGVASQVAQLLLAALAHLVRVIPVGMLLEQIQTTAAAAGVAMQPQASRVEVLAVVMVGLDLRLHCVVLAKLLRLVAAGVLKGGF
jgi:hypothetical protein